MSAEEVREKFYQEANAAILQYGGWIQQGVTSIFFNQSYGSRTTMSQVLVMSKRRTRLLLQYWYCTVVFFRLSRLQTPY